MTLKRFTLSQKTLLVAPVAIPVSMFSVFSWFAKLLGPEAGYLALKWGWVARRTNSIIIYNSLVCSN